MAFQVDDSLYDNIDAGAKTWDELSLCVRKDLAAWINIAGFGTENEPADIEITEIADRARLLTLYVEGRFKAWDCPHCEIKGEHTRVFCADVQDDEWPHFQGSLNQDFSFFGDSDKYTEEYIQAMCDSCRCHG